MNELALSVAKDSDLGLSTGSWATNDIAFVNPDVLAYLEFSSVDKVKADLGRSNWSDSLHRAWYAVSTIKAGWPRYYAADGSFTVGAGAGSSFPVEDPEFYVDRGLPFMRFSGGNVGNRLIAAELYAGRGIRHAFCRYVLVIEPDVQPNLTDGVKLPGFAGEYEDTVLHPPHTGSVTFSWRMIQDMDMTVSDYLYDGSTGSSFGSHQPYGPVFPVGVPVTIEQELNVDGQQPKGRVWINGILVGTRNVITDIDIEEIFLNVYHGGTKLAKGPLHYRLAAACIAKRYIGVPRELRTMTSASADSVIAALQALVASASNALSVAQSYSAPSAPAQTIDLFTVSAQSVVAGQSVTVNFATSNASDVHLDGVPVGPSGSKTVTLTADTTFTLVVDGAAPTLTQTLTVKVTAPVAGVPLWRQGAPVCKWIEIAGSSLSALVPKVPSANIEAWCGLAAVSDAARAMWVDAAGGGHSDSNDNGVYAIDWLADAPKWSVLCPPSASGDRVTAAESGSGMPARPYAHDGKPNSCHTYYSLVFVPQRNAVIRPFSAALWYGSQNAGNMDAFDLGSNTWNPVTGTWPNFVSPYPNCPSAGTQYLVCVDPATGDIWVGTISNNWIRWQQGVGQFGTWTVPAPGGYGFGNSGYHGAIIDAKRNRLVRAGLTSNGEFLSKLPCFTLPNFKAPSQGLTGITDTPVGARTITHDTANDQYYIADSLNVYRVDAATFAGVKVGPLPVAPANGVLGRFAYFSKIGGIVYYPKFAGNCWFYATA